MADEKKIAAYICRGCELGARLDTDQLANIAQREGKAQVVQQHDFLCSEEGIGLIQNDIDNQGVTHAVVAACSRRAKVEAFNLEGVAVIRTNLREGVIWAQPDSDENREITQEMADDYLRMGCAEARFVTQPAANSEVGSSKTLLVVGGGISGMTAALEISKAGYSVILVEKKGELGGWAGHLWKRTPRGEPFAEPEETGIPQMVQSIEADERISVHLNATVSRTSGAPGQFSVDISTESGSTVTENVGAIVQASGFENFDANQLPEMGFGKSPDVVDQAGLELLANEADGERIRRPSDGKEVQSVVFVQCAGQRSDKEGELSYCSGHCCNTSIKQALYFKEANPEVETAIIYRDLRTPGNGEDFYRNAQRKRVTFTKGTVSSVETGGEELEVRFKDLILDEETSLLADLVVLATGQIPNSGVDVEAELEAETAENDTDKPESSEEVVHSVSVSVESILNLDYRQGADLPHLRHGFSDSHFICFPYESRRTGIYACGPVRRPMDIGQATEDATGASLKAIQAAENAALGRAAHPRSGDLSFPSFRKEGCTQCKRCTVECPFGAINEDGEGYPLFNEGRCRRCGTCMGACPVRVISFENYSIDTVGQQLKSVDVPDEFEEKPRILVLACENDAYPALDMAARNGNHYSAFVRVVPVRCLGSVNDIWVKDALNSGYDGIVLMGCKKGDDYQCHFVKGSEMAHYRMSKIDDTLQQLQLEAERVSTLEVEITDIERAPRLLNDFVDQINEIGLSPFKF